MNSKILIIFASLFFFLSCEPIETTATKTPPTGVAIEPLDTMVFAPFSDLTIQDFDDTGVEEFFVAQKIRYLNIHCTASTGNVTGEWLLDFFKNERGWRKPGYNKHVQMSGKIDTLLPYDNDGIVQWSELSYGVKGQNRHSINVSYAGGVVYDKENKKLVAKDTRTVAQKIALAYIVSEVKCKFPWVEVRGHRDHEGVNKACPSFEIKGEYDFQ